MNLRSCATSRINRHRRTLIVSGLVNLPEQTTNRNAHANKNKNKNHTHQPTETCNDNNCADFKLCFFRFQVSITSLTAARNSLCVGHRLREPASTFQAYESLTNCSQRTTKITNIQRTSSRRSELTDRDLIPLIDRTIFFVLHNRWWCCRQCHRCRSRRLFVIAAAFACVIVFADTLGRERRTRSCVF